MGEKSESYVNFLVPAKVYQQLQKLAEARGQTVENALFELIQSEHRAIQQLRYPDRETLKREYLSLNEDEGHLEALREWDVTVGDGLGDK